MQVSTLLADPAAIRLDAFASEENLVVLRVHTVQEYPQCPLCQTHSSSLHSHYFRQVADLPWHDVAIRIELQTRRFRCRNEDCRRKVFCELLPKVVESYARKTVRLTTVLSLLAFALGGEAGARLASGLNLKVSGDTLLTLIRRQSDQSNPGVKVVGVDDFAFRRRFSYGTILVDLERRQPIDLLPDREAETLAEWLKAHPEIEIISRDRAGSYADGSRTGAPQATQVADRWHLLKNLGEAIERAVESRTTVITKATDIVRQSQQCQSKCLIEVGARTMLSSREETANASTDEFRRERFRQVHKLHTSGISIRKISQRLKMSRMTVYRYLRYEEFPARAPARERGSRLQPYLMYIHQRYAEGCHNATQLWREVVERGYPGKPAMVRRYVRNLRKRTSETTGEKLKTKELKQSFAMPSARKTAILLLKEEKYLKAEEKTFVQTLLSIDQEIERIQSRGTEFQSMIRKQENEKFADWLEAAAKCGIKEMAGFAWGLKQNKEAVTESMKSEWSQGQVEGQVNRLKMLKRQMYGRASFELLRARVLNRN